MQQFLNAEYESNRSKYPDGLPTWGKVVDLVHENGKRQCVKIKCWLWINHRYGAPTKNFFVICEMLKYSEGIVIDFVMEKCWPVTNRMCADPAITVCLCHAILRNVNKPRLLMVVCFTKHV